MDNAFLLQFLRDSSLEDGQALLESQLGDILDPAATGDLLADETLKQLFHPFLSLKLAELLMYFGKISHSDYARALGLKAKGDALLQIRHHQAAVDALDAAGSVFQSLGDDRNWARSRISWIVSAASLGKVEEALHHAARAREVFARLNEPYWVCVIDHNTAWIYKQVGRYHDASRLYENMLAIYPTVRDQGDLFIKRAIAMAKVSQAISLSWIGKFDQAYQLETEAQASFEALGETTMVVNSEINLANIEYIRGFYGSALRRYYQAQDLLLQHHIDNPKMAAELKLQIANVLLKLNRVNEACRLGSEAVEISRQLGASLHTTNVLCDYAATLVASGRSKEALAVYSEAVELFERGGFNHHAAVTKLQRAELLLETGSLALAYEEARALKAYFATMNLPARSVLASRIMAECLVKQVQSAVFPEKEHQHRQLAEALLLARQAALQARAYHLQEEAYKSWYLIGQLLALQADDAKAMRYYGVAIAQIERITDDLAFDLSPSFLRSAWSVYEETIALCLRRKRKARAFGYLEQARSMALRQYLHASSNQLVEQEAREDLPSSSILQANRAKILEIRDQLKTWQDRYRSYSLLLDQVDSSVSPAVERGIIEDDLRSCEAKLSELFERLYLQQATTTVTAGAIPQKKGRKQARKTSFDSKQLQRRLLPGQLLLAYFLYGERLIIFALNHEKLVTFEIPDGVKLLKRHLHLLQAHLQPGGWRDPQQPPQQAIRVMLNKLYQLLIAPVQTLLPAHEGLLTIVPYGPLHQFPFHALYDGSHYLIEQFQVQCLPASSILEMQERAFPPSKPPLILGYSGQGHLLRATEEASTLAAMLHGRCYLEDQASIARFIAEAPGSPHIHIATHAQSRSDDPNFSSIQLADGRFNAIDAFSLDLRRCELVTLSGCETGLAFSGGGDEQLGLGRAFLAAGAKTLVMSLWPVDDLVTNEFMHLFYTRLLAGDGKAQALRRAQCIFIRRSSTVYPHPYYWAAFRLVGDVGPLRYIQPASPAPVLETESEKISLANVSNS